MKERLDRRVVVRITSNDFNELNAINGNNSQFLRGSIRMGIAYAKSITSKVNSENRDVSVPAEQ